MSWPARLMGLEGRVDEELIVAPDPWRTPERPPREINVPHMTRLTTVAECDPLAPVPYDVVVYRYEQQADDGTLIYRRVTPALSDGWVTDD